MRRLDEIYDVINNHEARIGKLERRDGPLKTEDVVSHLRTIASRGHTTDEDNQWLFDVADWLGQ